MENPKPNGELPKTTEPTELDKIWQEYLQKCCEVGQIMHTLEQIDSQKRQFEKNLDVTQRAVTSAANKHKELREKQLKTPPPPTVELNAEQASH